MQKIKLVDICIIFSSLHLFCIFIFLLISSLVISLNNQDFLQKITKSNNIYAKNIEFKLVGMRPVLYADNVKIENSNASNYLINRINIKLNLIKSLINLNLNFDQVVIDEVVIEKVKDSKLEINKKIFKFIDNINLNKSFSIRHIMINKVHDTNKRIQLSNFKIVYLKDKILAKLKVNSLYLSGLNVKDAVIHFNFNSNYVLKTIKLASANDSAFIQFADYKYNNINFFFIKNNKSDFLFKGSFDLFINDKKILNNQVSGFIDNKLDNKFFINFNLTNDLGKINNINLYKTVKNNEFVYLFLLNKLDLGVFKKYLNILNIKQCDDLYGNLKKIKLIFAKKLRISAEFKNLIYKNSYALIKGISGSINYKNNKINIVLAPNVSVKTKKFKIKTISNITFFKNLKSFDSSFFIKNAIIDENKFQVKYYKKGQNDQLYLLLDKTKLVNIIKYLNFFNFKFADGVKSNDIYLSNIKLYISRKLNSIKDYSLEANIINSSYNYKNITFNINKAVLDIRNKLVKLNGKTSINKFPNLHKFNLIYNIKNQNLIADLNFSGKINEFIKILAMYDQKFKIPKKYKLIGNIESLIRLSKHKNNISTLKLGIKFKNVSTYNSNLLKMLQGSISYENGYIFSKKLIAKFYDNSFNIDVKTINKKLLIIANSPGVDINLLTRYCPNSCQIKNKFPLSIKISRNWPYKSHDKWLFDLKADLKNIALNIKNFLNKPVDDKFFIKLKGELSNDLNYNVNINNFIKIFYEANKLLVLIGNNYPLYKYNPETKIQFFANIKELPMQLISELIENISFAESYATINGLLICEGAKLIANKFNNILIDYEYNNKNKLMIFSKNFHGLIKELEDKIWKIDINQWRLNFVDNDDVQVNQVSNYKKIILNINNLIINNYNIKNIKTDIINQNNQLIFKNFILHDDLIDFNGELNLNSKYSFNLYGNFTSNNSSLINNKFFNFSDFKYSQAIGLININGELNNTRLLNTISGDIVADLYKGSLVLNNKQYIDKLNFAKFLSILNPERILNNLNFSDIKDDNLNFDHLYFDASLNHNKLLLNSLWLENSTLKLNSSGSLNLINNFLDILIKIKPKITSSIPAIAAFSLGAPVGIGALLVDKLVNYNEIGSKSIHLKGNLDDIVFNFQNRNNTNVEILNLNEE